MRGEVNSGMTFTVLYITVWHPTKGCAVVRMQAPFAEHLFMRNWVNEGKVSWVLTAASGLKSGIR